MTPLLEAGKVFLPSGAPWLDDYIDELAAFPHGAHDDAVDSTTMALGREPAILTYLKNWHAGIEAPKHPPISAA